MNRNFLKDQWPYLRKRYASFYAMQKYVKLSRRKVIASICFQEEVKNKALSLPKTFRAKLIRSFYIDIVELFRKQEVTTILLNRTHAMQHTQKTSLTAKNLEGLLPNLIYEITLVYLQCVCFFLQLFNFPLGIFYVINFISSSAKRLRQI